MNQFGTACPVKSWVVASEKFTVAVKVLKGDYDRKGNYDIIEIAGLYWHFVDLVWVFIFAFFYLW